MSSTDVVAAGQPAKRLGRSVAGEPATEDQDPVRELVVRLPLPLVSPAGPGKDSPPQRPGGDGSAADRESSLSSLFIAPPRSSALERSITSGRWPPEANLRYPASLSWLLITRRLTP